MPRSTAPQDLLARFARNGPRSVSLALAALLAGEASRVALALTSRASTAAHATAPTAPTAANRALPVGVDARGIVTAHLFGIADLDPSGDPASPRPSTANLVLDGTIATQDAKRGMAIIHGEGPAKVYSVGEDVGGASLNSVYLDHVLLSRGGSLEILRLPRSPRLHAALAALNADSSSELATYVDSAGRVVDKPPSTVDTLMRTVGSYDDKQKFRGYRVYPQGAGKGLRALGLTPGDLLTAVNGTPLDDPRRGQQILDTIGSSDQVTVTVERQGQTLDVALDITAAMNDMTASLASTATGQAIRSDR
jgi:general secretion pathway protein C